MTVRSYVLTRYFFKLVHAVCFSSVLLAATSGVAQADAKSASTPQSKGQTIGEIIKSAFTTAFPIAQDILKLFHPDSSSAPGTNKKKNDAPSAVPSEAAVTKAVEDAHKKWLQDAQIKLAPIGDVASEVRVVQIFSSDAALATQHIAEMRAVLVAEQGNPKFSTKQLEKYEKQLADSFTESTTVTAKDFEVIRDSTLQGRLRQLQRGKKDILTDIHYALTENKAAALKDALEALNILIGGIDSIAAAELQQLQSETVSVAKWASGAEGPGNLYKLPTPSKALIDSADAAVATSTAVHLKLKEQFKK
jgi:hypothetical protein